MGNRKNLMMHKAVFLDRDGTVNEEVGYVNHIDRVTLLPRAAQAIRLLNEHGFKTVVMTNQSGVARGYFSEALVNEIHQRIQDSLREEGAYLDGIYYCPHHPDVGNPPYRQKCRCRKPETGMVEEAVKRFQIDCSRSYMVGDRGLDIAFAHKIGTKSILVLTGYGKGEWEHFGKGWKEQPDHVAQDLYEAVQWILFQESSLRSSTGGSPEGKQKVEKESEMPISKELLDILACPKCKGDVYLNKAGDGLICKVCHLLYQIKDDIPVMLIDEALPYKGEE